MGCSNLICGCWQTVVRAPARLRILLVRLTIVLSAVWMSSFYITIQAPSGHTGWSNEVAAAWITETPEDPHGYMLKCKAFVPYVGLVIPGMLAAGVAVLLTPAPRRHLPLAPPTPANRLLARLQSVKFAQASILALHVAYLVAATVRHSQSDAPTDKFLFKFANACGILAVMDLGLVAVPATKQSRLLAPLGLSYEQALGIHHQLGQLSIALLSVHALLHCVAARHLNIMLPPATCWTTNEVAKSEECGEGECTCYDYWSNFCGLVALLALYLLGVTALEWVRRRFYRLFWRAHVACAPLALVFAVMHWHKVTLYLVPSLAFYTASKWPALLHTLRKPLLTSKSLAPVPRSGNVLELQVFRAAKFKKFEAGQWVRVQVPQISRLHWHPFSVSSAPKDDTLRLLIRCRGPWTRRLMKLAEQRNKEGIVLRVDAFHGTADMTATACTYNACILVAGGIGVTPLLSLLRHLHHLDKANKLPLRMKGVHLVWVCKEAGLADHLERELKEASDSVSSAKFTVQVFVTGTAGGADGSHSHAVNMRASPPAGATRLRLPGEPGAGRSPFDLTRGLNVFGAVVFVCIVIAHVTAVWYIYLAVESFQKNLDSVGGIIFSRLLVLLAALLVSGVMSLLFNYLTSTGGSGLKGLGDFGSNEEEDDDADIELIPMSGDSAEPDIDSSSSTNPTPNANPFASIPNPFSGASKMPAGSKVVGASYQRSTGRPDLQALLNKHGLQKTGLFVCGPIQLVESLRDAVTFCEGLYDSDDNATRRQKRRFVIHSSTFEL